jgi:hypothetical protein
MGTSLKNSIAFHGYLPDLSFYNFRQNTGRKEKKQLFSCPLRRKIAVFDDAGPEMLLQPAVFQKRKVPKVV